MDLKYNDHYILVNDFTPRRAELLQYVCNHVSSAVPATVTTGVEDYRKALVLHDLANCSDYLRTCIKEVLPQVEKHLLGDWNFPVQQIEVQGTISGQGCYFKNHNDSGSTETCKRVLSWVYYLCEQPLEFTGGDLVLYPENGLENRIAPIGGTCVFFRSSLFHEVTKVESKELLAPRQSRVTANGWINY